MRSNTMRLLAATAALGLALPPQPIGAQGIAAWRDANKPVKGRYHPARAKSRVKRAKAKQAKQRQRLAIHQGQRQA